MSVETLAGIETAVQARLADLQPDAVITDWFVAYGSMSRDADADGGISHGIHYTSSNSSPQGVLGIATLGLGSLTDDLAPYDTDD